MPEYQIDVVRGAASAALGTFTCTGDLVLEDARQFVLSRMKDSLPWEFSHIQVDLFHILITDKVPNTKLYRTLCLTPLRDIGFVDVYGDLQQKRLLHVELKLAEMSRAKLADFINWLSRHNLGFYEEIRALLERPKKEGHVKDTLNRTTGGI